MTLFELLKSVVTGPTQIQPMLSNHELIWLFQGRYQLFKTSKNYN